RRLFARHRIPTYDTPGKAVRGFMHLVHYRRNQEMLMQTPPSLPDHFEPDVARARATITAALEGGLSWLPAQDAKAVLSCYGIPTARSEIAATPDEAALRAAEISRPVALKIQSQDIVHKS